MIEILARQKEKHTIRRADEDFSRNYHSFIRYTAYYDLIVTRARNRRSLRAYCEHYYKYIVSNIVRFTLKAVSMTAASENNLTGQISIKIYRELSLT